MTRISLYTVLIMFLSVAACNAKDASIRLTTGTMTLRIKNETDRLPEIIEGLTISMHLKDADIGEVVRILARRARINIVFPAGFASGTVTAEFEAVPLPDALRALLKTCGYDYVIERNLCRVYPR